jgi:hypothetical protein
MIWGSDCHVTISYRDVKIIILNFILLYNIKPSGKQHPSGEQLWCSTQVQALIVLLNWNSMQTKFDKCEHFCKWTARVVPLGTPALAISYILMSRTRFRSWSFYRYRKRFGDLNHCFPDHWNRENKEFRIY